MQSPGLTSTLTSPPAGAASVVVAAGAPAPVDAVADEDPAALALGVSEPPDNVRPSTTATTAITATSEATTMRAVRLFPGGGGGGGAPQCAGWPWYGPGPCWYGPGWPW